MNPPSKLNAAGKTAFRRAMAAIADRPDAENIHDAVDRYAWAVHTSTKIRAEWIANGEPVTLVQSNHVEGEHPMLRAMQAAERHAAQMAAALGLDVKNSGGKSKGGRPVGAVSAPDRAAAPPRLKVVG